MCRGSVYAVDGADVSQPLPKGTHLRVFAGTSASCDDPLRAHFSQDHVAALARDPDASAPQHRPRTPRARARGAAKAGRSPRPCLPCAHRSLEVPLLVPRRRRGGTEWPSRRRSAHSRRARCCATPSVASRGRRHRSDRRYRRLGAADGDPGCAQPWPLRGDHHLDASARRLSLVEARPRFESAGVRAPTEGQQAPESALGSQDPRGPGLACDCLRA